MRASILPSRGRAKGFNGRAQQLILTAALAAMGANSAMAASVWKGTGTVGAPTSGTWNLAGNWSPSGIPSSAGSTELDFTGTGGYTSTDDIAGAFQLNILNLSSSGSSTIAASSGDSMTFVANGSVAPTIVQSSGAGTFTVAAPISLGAATTINQASGAEIDFNGAVTGTGSFSINNTSGSGSSTVSFSGANAFNGLTINSKTIAVAGLSTSTTTLGSGIVTLNGGTLKLQGQQFNGATAHQGTIGLTGASFDRDIVIENAASPTSNTIDNTDSLYEAGFGVGTKGVPGNSGATPRTLTSLASTSASTGANSTFIGGVTFQLQPYTGNNAAHTSNALAKTITLSTPTAFQSMDLLYTGSVISGVSVGVSFIFSDSTTSTGSYSFLTQDWFNSNTSTALHSGQYTGSGFDDSHAGNLTQVDFQLTGADQGHQIQSIVFTPSAPITSGTQTNKGLDIMAVSGATFSTGVSPTQGYANNVNVTNDSSISVSNSLSATMGNLTIGSNRLSVSSPDVSGNPYSLTLGTVTLNGNATFDVANSANAGLGTLTLGSLNDMGTGRTLTINPTGSGAVTLTADAASLATGTIINLQHGTLNSNSGAALGTMATVNIGTGATFGVGAAQTISALSGTAGAVLLGGGNLTIGSTDNLSGSYGGTISGPGSIIKAGTGTVTFSGANTLAGSVIVSNGASILTGVQINLGTVVIAGPSVVNNGSIVSGPAGAGAVMLNPPNGANMASLVLDNTPGRTFPNAIWINSGNSGTTMLGAQNTSGVTTFSGIVTLGTGPSGDNGHDLMIGATGGGELDFTGNLVANGGSGHSNITINNLSNSGTATVKFTGNNTYAGGTVVNAGVTLISGLSTSTSTLGSGKINLVGGNLLLQGRLPTGSQQTIAVSGFDADTILDQNASEGDLSSTDTSTSTIDNSGLFYEAGYSQGMAANGLPNGGAITSATTGHLFQLAAYTDLNTLRFSSGATSSKSLTLGTAGKFQTLDFLSTGQGDVTYSVILHFVGGTTDTLGAVSTKDWYNGNSPTNAVTGLNAVKQADGSYIDDAASLTIQENDLTLSAADQLKMVQSIEFLPTSLPGVSAEIYAISGTSAAGFTPQATQAYANNILVSGNSTIDISGSLTASAGALHIGGSVVGGANVMSVTSSDTSGNAYSLTLGMVTFDGNASSFNVSNSAGGGTGTLIVGSLNDQGAHQVLTKSGSGTMVLSAPATAVTDLTIFNVTGGTLVSNDANALNYVDSNTGNFNAAGVAVANGATFSIGASQQIDNLQDYDAAPVVNGATVKLNGNILAIGSTHDRNSTFSGRITDGTTSGGGLYKMGGGTLTLVGANTYSGPTTVGFGTLVVANASGSATGSGDVTINQGTLASGTVGSISGNVLGGTNYHIIAPGGVGSIGKFSIGGLSSGFHTTINFDLGTGSGVVTNGDLLTLGSGTVNIANGTVISFGANPMVPGVDYRLIGGSIGGIDLSHFTLPAAPAGVSYALRTDVEMGYIDLVVSPAVVGANNLVWDNHLSTTGDGLVWDNGAGGISQNWNNSGAASGFSAGDNVNFTNANNAHYSINIGAAVMPTSVTVSSSGAYAIGSTGGFGIGDVTPGATTLTQSGGGTLTIQNVNSYTGATNVSGSGTTFHLSSTGALATGQLTVGAGAIGNVDGKLTGTPAVIANGTINLGIADIVNDPSSIILVRNWGALTVGVGGKVAILPASSKATRTVLVAASLSNSGKIDLSNNDMIIHGGNIGSVSTAGSIPNQIKVARNAGGSYFNGATGITSSKAANDTRFMTTLGYHIGGAAFDPVNAGSPFDGVNTTSADVLLKYTYYGDANLDGAVNGADYALIDTGFGTHATGWASGDFNYDGVVDGTDYSLIDNTFNQLKATGASSLAIVASPSELIASAVTSSVPEPTTFGVLGIGAIGLMGRRRRRGI
jgi:fibronectin-binding autotransporter adhesin